MDTQTDKESMALITLLIMTIEQQDTMVRLLARNLNSADSHYMADRKFLNNVKQTQQWAKTFADWAERTMMSVLNPDEIEAFDAIRRHAQDLLTLNMLAYEYLTDPRKINTILRQIQKYKTRRGNIRDSTIKQTIFVS